MGELQRYIVGTAGHIDHGKTSLLAALTGIDADRLPEEKARGITIDLGFAHLQGDGIRIGFIDAPGHERFVHNMLAGAGGLDALLLVVAADEGVRPQTLEHFAIARLLAIPCGIVALTKCDRADAARCEEAERQVRELVAGTFLEGAPVLPVSARTGEGLPALREALLRLPAARRDALAARPLRLPVDRAFVIAGFGPVVTGSLVEGAVAPGDHVEILPGRLAARVRKVEVHGQTVERARAGERTSVNLAGIAIERLRRGQTLAGPGAPAPTLRLLVRLELLADAPALASGARVRLHHFATETAARVRLLAGETLSPGASAAALLTADEPLAARAGDRFVIRRESPAVTVGGGVVLDCEPPRRLAEEDVRVFLSGSLSARLRRRVERAPRGISAAALAAAEGVAEEEVRAALAGASPEGAPIRAVGDFFLTAALFSVLQERVRQAVARELSARPGSSAARATVVARALRGFPAREAEALLAEAARAGAVEVSGEQVRLPGQKGLAPRDAGLADRIAELFERRGLDSPSSAEVARELAAKPQVVEGLIAYLARTGTLARLPGGFYVASRAAEEVAARLRAERPAAMSVPRFKEMFGLTRRIAIPLLEWLDEKKVTRRRGDLREVI